MMLDKGQIKDWDGEPENKPGPADKSAAAPQAGIESPAVEPRTDMAGAFFDAREALPTGERVTMTPEQVAARKRRGQWLALAIFAFIILVFVLTMAKVGSGISGPT